MRKAILLIVLFVVLLIAPAVLRYTQYYGLSGVKRSAVPVYEATDIQPVPTPDSFAFVDTPDEVRGWCCSMKVTAIIFAG